MNSINSRYIFRNRILSRKWDLWWRVSKLSNKILAMHIFDSNSTVLKKFEKKSSVWKIEFYFCFINVFRGSRRIRSEDKNSKKNVEFSLWNNTTALVILHYCLLSEAMCSEIDKHIKQITSFWRKKVFIFVHLVPRGIKMSNCLANITFEMKHVLHKYVKIKSGFLRHFLNIYDICPKSWDHAILLYTISIISPGKYYRRGTHTQNCIYIDLYFLQSSIFSIFLIFEYNYLNKKKFEDWIFSKSWIRAPPNKTELFESLITNVMNITKKI